MPTGPGFCARCGAKTEGANITYCIACRTKIDRENKKQQADQERNKKYEQERRENEQYTLTSNPDGSVTKTYKNGYKTTESAASIKAKFIIITSILIILIAGAFIWIRHKNYTAREESLYSRYTITESLEGDSADFISTLLSNDNNCAEWELTIIPQKDKNFIKSIFNFSDSAATIRYWTDDGIDIYSYEFNGYDAGTGLKGNYYITTVNNKLSLIDLKKRIIYPQETQFFEEHYEALAALMHDTLITSLTKNLTDGEYGRNSEYNSEVLKNSTVSVCNDSALMESRILDESSDKRILYIFSYFKEKSYSMSDISTFRTYGENESDDPLEKIFATADDTVSIDIYQDKKQVADIRYKITNGEHSFEFDDMDYKTFKDGTKYILKPDEGKIIYSKWNNDTLKHEQEEYSASEKQEEYDFLMSIIPKDYVRANIDIGTANKTDILGIVTIYKTKDSNGNDKAKLVIFFGKLDGFIYNINDNEYIKMDW